MPSAGWRSGTAMTISTWSRCWPGRTGAAPGSATSGTGSGMPAWPPSSGTGCGRPRPVTGRLPAARRGPNRRRRPGAAWRKRRGSRCGGRSAPPPRRPGSEQDFFARLRQSGVLVRTRHSTRDPAQLTGYAVALPGDTTKAGDPVWYGGGKLAADLTLPKLRRRWPQPGSDDRFTAAERSAAWDHVAQVVDHASAHIRGLLAGDDPGAAADAAWATSDTLHAAAAALGSRILRQAADAYDRAARAPYGRTPAPTPAGDGLRRAARLLAAYGYITSDPSFRPLVLIIRLAVLAEAVADLRQSQQHAAQAAGALRAAQQLHAARGIYAVPAAAGQRPARSAATLAGAGFPAPPAPDPATPRHRRGPGRQRHPDPGSSHDASEQRSRRRI